MRYLAFLNHWLAVIGRFFRSPLLLILRLFFGIGFFLAGWGKLQNISSFADVLLTLDIPYPDFFAWATALTEAIGGIFLTLGLLSHIVTLPLIIVMAVAYATAHAEAIYAFPTNPKLFVEQGAFNFLLTSLLVFAFGPGIFSLDALLFRNMKKDEQKLAK